MTHKWVPSRLGHGETMCERCMITNREAAVLGLMNECAESCDQCAGRGFELDWIDQGGQMRAVPGNTCPKCNGAGQEERPSQAAAPEEKA